MVKVIHCDTTFLTKALDTVLLPRGKGEGSEMAGEKPLLSVLVAVILTTSLVFSDRKGRE